MCTRGTGARSGQDPSDDFDQFDLELTDGSWPDRMRAMASEMAFTQEELTKVFADTELAAELAQADQ